MRAGFENQPSQIPPLLGPPAGAEEWPGPDPETLPALNLQIHPVKAVILAAGKHKGHDQPGVVATLLHHDPVV